MTATTLNSATFAGRHFAISTSVEALHVAKSVGRGPASTVIAFQPVKDAFSMVSVTTANVFQAAAEQIPSFALNAEKMRPACFAMKAFV
jgi:hypothetical protein